MIQMEKVFRRSKRINSLKGGKPQRMHYKVNAQIVKSFGKYKVHEEPIELTIIRATLVSNISFAKGFNSHKRYKFGQSRYECYNS